MSKPPTKDEREDFAAYCRQATNDQLRYIIAKEKAANRRVYAAIAEREAVSRGLKV